MADIYGSSLDALMQNRVAQQQADAADANAYNNFLAQIANTNIRRQEQQDMNAYRMGDLGVRRQLGMGDLGIRQQDVLGNNEYRRGQVDIGKVNAATHKADVDSLVAERPLARADQLKIAQMQADAALNPYLFSRPSSEAEMINANALKAYYGALEKNAGQPSKEAQLLKSSQEAETDNKVRELLATGSAKLLADYNNQTSGPLGGWTAWDSPETTLILSKVKSGMTPDDAAKEIVAGRLAKIYPSSSLFKNAIQAANNPPAPAPVNPPAPSGPGGTNNPSITTGLTTFGGKSQPRVFNPSTASAPAASANVGNSESVYGTNPFARSAYSQRLQQSLSGSGAARLPDPSRNVDYTVTQEEWNRLFPSLSR